jgi:hypothetical protein
MNRLAAVSVIAGALVAAACQDSTGPDTPQRVSAVLIPDEWASLFAEGSTTECSGVLTGPQDNVVVPSGSHCDLDGATVKGSVLVLPKASLRAIASHIVGNVQGDNSNFVCLIFESTVGGNFSTKGGVTGGTTGHDIGTVVRGNTSITENAGHTFIDAATVGGDILVAKNTGSIEVQFNKVGGNLQVEQNVPSAVHTGAPPGVCGIPNFLAGMGITNNDVGQNGGGGGGNLQVLKNTGPAFKQVQANTVKGIIQCYDNTPTFLGTGNTGRADPPPNQCTGTST